MNPDAESGIHVWVVEDNRNFRDTLVELLGEQPGISCSLVAGTAEEAVRSLEAGRVPQVVLMDLGLPGMGGVAGIRRIREISPATHVVVLTVHEGDDEVFEALCAGANGYLLKPASGDRIIEAIQTAMHGGAPMNAFIARKVLATFARIARPRGKHNLTERERELLQLLCEEKTQKEIAETLFLSPHTVDTHLRNIYGKLQVHSRTGAVAKAIREGLI